MLPNKRNSNGAEVTTSYLVDIIIFISSYFPLFLILLIKDIKCELIFCICKVQIYPSFYLNHPWWSILLFATSFICLILLISLRTFLFSSERGGTNVILLSCKRVRGDMLNFTIPFLVGLIGFTYDTLQQTFAFLIFMIFMFLFLKKDESIMLNPMFLLLNLRLYRIEYQRVGGERKDTIDVLSIGDLVLSNSLVKIKKVRGVSFVLGNSLI